MRKIFPISRFRILKIKIKRFSWNYYCHGFEFESQSEMKCQIKIITKRDSLLTETISGSIKFLQKSQWLQFPIFSSFVLEIARKTTSFSKITRKHFFSFSDIKFDDETLSGRIVSWNSNSLQNSAVNFWINNFKLFIFGWLNEKYCHFSPGFYKNVRIFWKSDSTKTWTIPKNLKIRLKRFSLLFRYLFFQLLGWLKRQWRIHENTRKKNRRV